MSQLSLFKGELGWQGADVYSALESPSERLRNGQRVLFTDNVPRDRDCFINGYDLDPFESEVEYIYLGGVACAELNANVFDIRPLPEAA